MEICNYVFPVGEEFNVSANDFEYFLDEDSKDDICNENNDTIRGIWANFKVLNNYAKDVSWEDLADVRIKIKDFEIV